MEEIWTRIVDWLGTHVPELVPSRKGATQEAIEQAEAELGFSLPAGYRDWLLLCDGQSSGAPGLLDPWTFLRLSHVIRYWRDQCALADDLRNPRMPAGPGIRAQVWDRRWIPIASDLGGNYLAIDLDPAPGGSAGQIIDCQHDPPATQVVAPSFSALMARLADDLEANRYQAQRSEDGYLLGLLGNA
jgi:cell wall assembly regulator SMI1